MMDGVLAADRAANGAGRSSGVILRATPGLSSRQSPNGADLAQDRIRERPGQGDNDGRQGGSQDFHAGRCAFDGPIAKRLSIMGKHSNRRVWRENCINHRWRLRCRQVPRRLASWNIFALLPPNGRCSYRQRPTEKGTTSWTTST